jgi:calcineurin-like phosphoesterase family protein
MTTWFTADPHFGHANIIRYCNRPYLSSREQQLLKNQGARGRWEVSRETLQTHDSALLHNINSLVQPEDTLWILGDFCRGGHQEAARYRRRIGCQNVHLVWGNHDDRSIGSLFTSTLEQGMVEVEGQAIWLNHYPMRSWNRSFQGSWMLYGHVHGRLTEIEETELEWMLTKDVGVDACDYKPISFEQLTSYMRPRIAKWQARKERIISGGEPDGELRACEFNGQTPCLIPENTRDYLVRRLD